VAAVISALAGFALKRASAHILPGFLLYAGILMALDVLSISPVSFTTIFFNPINNVATIQSVILFGLFVGAVLGIMIDGFNHLFFEHFLLDKLLLKHYNQTENNAFRFWLDEKFWFKRHLEPSSDYLYPRIDRNKDIGASIVMLLQIITIKIMISEDPGSTHIYTIWSLHYLHNEGCESSEGYRECVLY
jgi:hypothetical protein